MHWLVTDDYTENKMFVPYYFRWKAAKLHLFQRQTTDNLEPRSNKTPLEQITHLRHELIVFLSYYRPSSMNLWRWTSWTQSWRMTSKWRFGGGKKPKKTQITQLFCICCFGIAALFSFFFSFFLGPINFLGRFGRQIRKKMIDGQTGNYTISTLVKSQDEVICVCDHVRGKDL